MAKLHFYIRRLHLLVWFVNLCILFTPNASHSQVDKNWREKVPAALQDWIPWVLREQQLERCVKVNGQANQEICSWYAGLALDLSANRVEFNQLVSLVRADRVSLPYAERIWPSNLKVNGELFPIVMDNGVPVVHLQPGSYEIQGQLVWDKAPASLRLPDFIGSIKINRAADLPEPEIDSAGNLWLRTRAAEKKSAEEQEFVTYQIFRRIEDNIPVELETFIRLNVGGRARDLTLPDILLGSNPYNINSSLPVRIDRERRLWIRASAGSHTITIQSMLPAPFQALQLVDSIGSLVEREVWSFAARPELRSVTLAGAERVDPQQVNVPEPWLNFPAYVMSPGGTLEVKEEKRADVQSQSNQLTLQRSMQLHSDGNQFSISDRLSGTIFSDGRLNFQDRLQPGSVAINDVDQAITQIADDQAGIEVRAGQLNLTMDGRIDRSAADLPVTGWLTEIGKPTIDLYLQPGWSLLHATGADYISSSWLQSWDLLKIFLVLTTVVLVQRLFGLTMALVTAFTLVLVEHNFSLSQVLIFVLIANVLLKYVGENFFASVLRLVKNLTLIGLIIAFAAFSLERIRLAIYPQLAPYSTAGSYDYLERSSQPIEVLPTPESMSYNEGLMQDAGAPPEVKSRRELAKTRTSALAASAYNYLVDSGNLPQTGFGKVDLRGPVYRLTWSGLVGENETFKLYLLSPNWNIILAFFQVILAAWLIFKLSFNSLKSLPLKLKSGPAAALILVSVLFLKCETRADDKFVPTPQLLKELKEFAIKNEFPVADCLPNCGRVASMELELNGQTLKIVTELHASSTVALDLFANVQNIVFSDARPVLEAGQAWSGLMRKNDNLLVSAPEGRSVFQITGVLRGSSASLTFASPPGFVAVKAPGWKVSGINENQAREIRFERTVEDTINADQAANSGLNAVKSVFLEPRVTLVREINLGTEWVVNSSVQLASANSSVVELDLPLLKGESVTSPGAQVKNDRIQVILQPGSLHYTWSSVLKIQDQLALEAVAQNNIAEIWQVNLSNLWHAEFSGTPRIQSGDVRELQLAEWRPRPGEQLTIDVTRPQAIPGPTRTVNSAKISYELGPKIVDVVLNLDIKSSLGQPYSLNLPVDARISQVQLNGQNITSYSVKDNVIRVDLNPGSQTLELRWTQPVDSGFVFKPAALDLQTPAVNINTQINMPTDRWILWTSGPKQGPAILFWGLLPALIIAAYGIFRTGLTPFTFSSALLLMVGLSFQPLTTAMIVFGLFLVLGWRGKNEINRERRFFSNFRQLLIALWAIVAVFSLLDAIQSGLLGQPYMRIMGNGSYLFTLNWYQDVSAGSLPGVTVYSLPIFYYRLVMLLWALWLAFSIVKWAIWGWNNYTRGGGWVPPKPKPAKVNASESAKPETDSAK